MKILALFALLLFGAGSLSAQSKAKASEAAPAATAVPVAPAAKTAGGEQGPQTEILADEAFFDSAKDTGTFTGHVKVTDPRFIMQSDRLTIFISKGATQGLEKAIADGNVGVVRDRATAPGAPPQRDVGRSDRAIYTPKNGNIELSGTPRVQQGINTHIATSPGTVMILNENGQLTTRGPSLTQIRQDLAPQPSPKP